MCVTAICQGDKHAGALATDARVHVIEACERCDTSTLVHKKRQLESDLRRIGLARTHSIQTDSKPLTGSSYPAILHPEAACLFQKFLEPLDLT